jgi:AraC family carnitine catabolism transcriptional activator
MSKNRINADPPDLALRRAADPAATVVTRLNFLIVPRFNMATLITMIEPLRIANYLASQPLYAWDILSFDGAEITASNGLTITARPVPERLHRDETLFVLASWGAEDYVNRELFSWVRRQAREGIRICSVELGCYLVAKAGLLSGARLATHWSWAPGFQEQFPDIALVEQIYTLDDHILTCAGGLAGVDLMLRLIADAHGEGMAGEVADQMLHHPIRPASAPQRRTLGQGIETMAPVLRQAITLIERNISEPLSVPDIAATLGISQRQLERQFHRGVGCSVVQFGTLVRLQHARVLLISTKLTVREIATATGFNTLSHFAYAFRKCFDRRPSDYRQAWPTKDATPSWPGTLTRYLETLQHRTARAVREGKRPGDGPGL